MKQIKENIKIKDTQKDNKVDPNEEIKALFDLVRLNADIEVLKTKTNILQLFVKRGRL
jgi:hypothetical protein